MIKVFSDDAWNDYLYWQKEDKKTLRKINILIRDIDRNIHVGLGKPEALRGDLSGWWSRHIDDKNRLIYRVQTGQIEIAQCRTHYGNK